APPDGAGRPPLARSQHPLHDRDIEPPAELPTDLPLDTDRLEPTGPVEGDRRLVATHDPGHDGMETMEAGQPYQLDQQQTSDALASLGRMDVDGVLHARAVGGPRPVWGER